MRSFDCIVIGDVLFDIIANTSSAHINITRGGTSYCQHFGMFLGGSGNVAAGLASLGSKVVFVGKAGDDLLGKLYDHDLKKRGVVSNICFDKEKPTGVAISFMEKKERSFLVFRGANDKLSIGNIEKATDLIRRSKYIYVSGYSLVNEPQQSAILHGIETSRKYSTKIVFDPGAHNLIRSKPQLFLKILDLCDIFSPNLDEASAIMNATNMDDIINKLRDKVQLTALKCGENGCILISEKKTVKVSGFNAKCLDPTGAGDAFTAALISGLAHELPLEPTGQLANWFAAQVVRHLGPRSFPTKSRINHFLGNLTAKTTPA